jgi:Spa2 homology domain (SHD) of GIT
MTTKVRPFSLYSLCSHPSPVTLVPFLPVRDEFHPKRNQARQKLATLPLSRFRDLSSDVYYELVSRYPQFKEEVSHSFPSHQSLFSRIPLPLPPLPPPPQLAPQPRLRPPFSLPLPPRLPARPSFLPRSPFLPRSRSRSPPPPLEIDNATNAFSMSLNSRDSVRPVHLLIPPKDETAINIARTHYDELSKHLSSYLETGSISLYLSLHSLTFSPFQSQQIIAQQHDRNSRGLHASSFKNYLRMFMMN